jgi:hypothetical protein
MVLRSPSHGKPIACLGNVTRATERAVVRPAHRAPPRRLLGIRPMKPSEPRATASWTTSGATNTSARHLRDLRSSGSARVWSRETTGDGPDRRGTQRQSGCRGVPRRLGLSESAPTSSFSMVSQLGRQRAMLSRADKKPEPPSPDESRIPTGSAGPPLQPDTSAQDLPSGKAGEGGGAPSRITNVMMLRSPGRGGVRDRLGHLFTELDLGEVRASG